jgi:dephospho-CoA kinase
MKVIGLTGGSGAGKGEVCKMFAIYGIESIDTDTISREITRKGEPCLEELTRYFSHIILDEHGELNRKKLAEIAFASKDNKDNLDMLNQITHKHIIEECHSRIDRLKDMADMQGADKPAVIIDAPLLFESKFNRSCDIIISVIADTSARLERIIKRDNLTLQQAVRRIESQKDNDFFIRNSTYVIYNNGVLKEVKRQVADIYTNMLRLDLI